MVFHGRISNHVGRHTQ